MKTWGCVGKCLWEVGTKSLGGYDNNTLYTHIKLPKYKKNILFKNTLVF